MGHPGDRRDRRRVHGGSDRPARRRGRRGRLALRGLREGVRRPLRHTPRLRRLGRARRRRRHRCRLRRHPARRPPHRRRTLPGGRAERAVREGVHAEPARGRGTGRAGPGARPLPHGSHVDVLQPGDPPPQGPRRRRRDRRGPHRAGRLRPRGPLPALAPAARPRPGRRRPPRPRRLPGLLRPPPARRALGHRRPGRPVRRGRRPADGAGPVLGLRGARRPALLPDRRYGHHRLRHRLTRPHRHPVRLLPPRPPRPAPRRA